MTFPTEILGGIWDEPEVDCIPRLFISHKAEDKQLAMGIKARLRDYHCIASFVAHEDIKPSEEWESVIKRALREMDGLIALLTPEFRDSQWTDQEIGFALCREVPVISVRLGTDPYGFIGKYQAILGGNKTPSNLADEVARTFFKNSPLGDSRIDAYLEILSRTVRYDTASDLFTRLHEFENLSSEQERRLVDIFNTNCYVSESYRFRGKIEGGAGHGIVVELKRITGNDYEIITQIAEQGYYRQLIPHIPSVPTPPPHCWDDDLPWGDKDEEDELPW